MTNNYAEYINANLNRLANYLNHLADFDKQYRQAVYNLCNGKTDDVEKSDKTLEYEQEIQEAYDNATRLYNDLKLIAQKYNSRMNVKWDLESFHRRLTTTRLPVYERATLKMTTTERCPKNGYLTGLAAEVYDNYLTDEERKMLDDYMQGNTATENGEIIPVLQGGLQYNHYTEQEDSDYYVENEIDGDEGYSGDSMELAAEYKSKYDEEQKKIAEELAKQKAAAQTTPQQSSANWIKPLSGAITSYYGWRIHPTLGTKKFHDGIDIGVNLNTPVKAVDAGKVIKAEWYNGYGKYIEIDHGNNIISFYGHLNEYKVSKGQFVEQGQVIALSGNTAGIGTNGKIMTTGAHLHFGVHKNNDKVNPLDFIRNF